MEEIVINNSLLILCLKTLETLDSYSARNTSFGHFLEVTVLLLFMDHISVFFFFFFFNFSIFILRNIDCDVLC